MRCDTSTDSCANSFQANIDSITRAISASTAEDLSSLAQVASHNGKVEDRKLPRYIERVKTENADVDLQLGAARLDLARNAVEVHTQHREIIETSIRVLEQTIDDPAGDHDWRIRGVVDLAASVEEGTAVLRVTEVVRL